MVQKRFSAFFESYVRFIQKDKTRIWSKKRFSALFRSYPRFISKLIKPTLGRKDPGGRWSRDLLKSSRFLISVVLSIWEGWECSSWHSPGASVLFTSLHMY